MNSNETSKSLTLLTQRLERLETQNRWLVRAALVLGAVLLLVVTLGAEPAQPNARETVHPTTPQVVSPGVLPELVVTQEMVRTKNLQLVDDDGNLRADLKLEQGYPMLSLYDEVGNPRAVLSYFLGNPALILYDDEKRPRALLRLGAENPHLEMYDQKRLRADYNCIDGGPGLALYDDDGTPRASFDLNKYHQLFCLRDEEGHVIFEKP